ncbi:DUF6572 domain-containing protein [Bacteroides pyogenes]|uniref:DUF6572 domain-containing protein n=1 Tax=Bacteroides pyogenes TaxID=310300 RepID=UPI001F2390E3|nr:DUF6572 domain-containing protein [Bacteroides pyogenes]MCF2709619.1 hypothetical protein [Bacteroides pyogenes]
MSVDNAKQIDFISEKGNNVILTISDHLEWDEENEHIFLLQEKINAYLMAIESGQLNEKYPTSVGKKVVISVALKYEPNENGVLFLSNVNDTLSNSGYGFDYYILK